MNSHRPLLDAASGSDPFIIAEIGVNHDGKRTRALELVAAAALAGADAVKFQWFDPVELLSSSADLAAYQRESGESDPREMLDRLQLSRDDMSVLIDSAHQAGLRAAVTVFSPRLVPEAVELPWDLLKVSSPDLVNRPLLEQLRAANRPLLVSTGGASLAEVQETISWIGTHGLGLLHCVSSYPTGPDDASLSAIRTLGDETGLPVGYSDHTSMVETGGLAVAAGATILEKHLTWNTAASGPDHAASMDPEGFTNYVSFARVARRMGGAARKRMHPSESEVMRASRQSVSVIDEVLPGGRLELKNLTTMRPGDGIPAHQLESLVGRRASRRIASRSLISLRDLESECDP